MVGVARPRARKHTCIQDCYLTERLQSRASEHHCSADFSQISTKPHVQLRKIICPAEAPCKHVVEIARAACRDAGGQASQALKELAAIRARDAERAVHQLFRKYRLTVLIKPETMCVGEKELSKLPFVPFSNWVRYLMDERLASDQLVGVPETEMQATLTEFWQRYEKIHPQHAMFKQPNLDLSRTVPVFSHIDEGRTYKRAGICILSVHGALGKGTRSWQRRFRVRKPNLKRSGLAMNYVRNTWSTQFLCCSLVRSAYAKDSKPLDMVMLRFASDMAMLSEHGVS